MLGKMLVRLRPKLCPHHNCPKIVAHLRFPVATAVDAGDSKKAGQQVYNGSAELKGPQAEAARSLSSNKVTLTDESKVPNSACTSRRGAKRQRP